MKMLFTVIICMISVQVFASGQAVYAVRCGVGASETYMAYSIWNLAQTSNATFMMGDNSSFEQQMQTKIELFKNIDPVLSEAMLTKLQDFNYGISHSYQANATPNFQWVTSIDDQIDIPEGFKPHENSDSCRNCSLIPVVAISYLPQKTKRYVVNRSVWDKLSESHKAASLINLFMYELAGERFEQGSAIKQATKRMQYFAAILFSSIWSEFTSYDYLSSLEDMGIIQPDQDLDNSNFGVVLNGVPFKFDFFLKTQDESKPLNYELDRKRKQIVFVRGYVFDNARIKLPTGNEITLKPGENISKNAILFSNGSFYEMDTNKFLVTLRDGTMLSLGDEYTKYGGSGLERRASFDSSHELLCAYNNYLSGQNLSLINAYICITLNGELAYFQPRYGMSNIVEIKFNENKLPVYGSYKNPKFYLDQYQISNSVQLAFCGKHKGLKVNGKGYHGIRSAQLYPNGRIEINKVSERCPRNFNDE